MPLMLVHIMQYRTRILILQCLHECPSLTKSLRINGQFPSDLRAFSTASSPILRYEIVASIQQFNYSTID